MRDGVFVLKNAVVLKEIQVCINLNVQNVISYWMSLNVIVKMDDVHNIAISAIHNSDHPQCQEEGCDAAGDLKCYLNDEEDTTYYYCWDHATQNGFCGGCGCFIAGWIENRNYCDNCWDEIKSAEGNNDDDEYNYDGI